jgi:N-sulfoglucosamine sulfohydrolase
MRAIDLRRPNILLITAHDIGRHLGCYGVPETGTDHLDWFADSGVRLTRFFSTAPQCSPARASLMTGRYPHAHGVIGICSPQFGFDLHTDERHLVGYLKDAGYHTALAGLQHETLRLDDLPFDMHLASHAPATEVAQAVMAHLHGAAKQSEPFYLQVGFAEAHRPWRHTEPYDERGVHVPPWLVDDPTARQDLAAFQGAIHAMDRAVGVILGALEAENLTANTVVVFVADHGIPYARAKHSLYEPGCAVAALLRWPEGGWTSGRVIDDLLSGVDLLPTMLDVAGLDVPARVHGRSFRALLDGGSYVAADAIFTEQSFNAYTDVSRAIRTDRLKLIANFTPGRAFYDSSQLWHPPASVPFIGDQPRTQHPSLEFYDLEADPLETANLAGDPEHASTLQMMAARLYAWMQATEDPLLEGLPQPPLYYRTLELLEKGTVK